MKKILFVLFFGFFTSLIFAAPFGLKMGMTIEEIEKEPTFIENDIYLTKPIKSHPLFEFYAVYVNEKTDLYQIRAISSTITTNKYGAELESAFNTVKDRIAKTYGKPEIVNKVDPDISEFNKKDEFWFMTLKEGSRILSAVWGEKIILIDDLDTVALDCVADNGYLDGTAHLTLYYYFKNTGSVEDEQDAVF